MYLIKLINGTETFILNQIGSRQEVPRITGSIKKAINSIDSFTFEILPNHPCYSLIEPFSSIIEVLDLKRNFIEFRGRVLLESPKMAQNGQFSKTVTCEGELAYLHDSKQRYGEYHNMSVKDFLKMLLDQHNASVESYKRFELGDVTVTDSNDSLYRYLNYESTYDAITDKLINRLGGELQIRHENGVNYLDYLVTIGSVKDTTIEIAKNLITISQEKDPTEIISRLIPLGAKLEDTEQRLDICSINNNKDYIDDPEAIAQFGIIEKEQIWDNVTIDQNLLTKGKAFLEANNKIKKKHKLSAYDLSVIGLDLDRFEIGCYYRVINPLMNIDEYLRVVEKTIDISSPQESTLTIGDKFDDIKTYQSEILTSKKAIDDVRSAMTSTIEVVGQVNSELNNTAVVVDETVKILNVTNETVAGVNKNVQDLAQSLNNTTQTLRELNERIDTISSNIQTLDNRVTKIQRRIAMGV